MYINKCRVFVVTFVFSMFMVGTIFGFQYENWGFKGIKGGEKQQFNYQSRVNGGHWRTITF